MELKKEEDDLAKAIQLSLKENLAKQAQLRNNDNNNVKIQTSSLYGTLPQTVQHEKRKVKALYDFEAAEENEITFKAGDILTLVDDTDPNWWRGSNYKQEGLFPSNFVTSDLSADFEALNENNSKKVSFDDDVSVKSIPPAKIMIDEVNYIERRKKCFVDLFF
jgi:signal transducing adaptor molecule